MLVVQQSLDEGHRLFLDQHNEAFDTAPARASGDRLARLLATQVALAKLVPDYWQRFEDVRAAWAADARIMPETVPSRPSSGEIAAIVPSGPK